MGRPIIALLTDFGTRDHYAGAMKGVALAICPEATLVDITHEIAPHDVVGGALELAASYRYFPPGTIFLVVVDPGVGSSRRAIAAEAGEFKFIAPDNGVLSVVFEEIRPRKIVELSDRRFARPTVSRTFEGRDRFAPAAAWLARGVEVSALGRPTGAAERLELPHPIVTTGERVAGEVLRVDRFGNLITNINRRTFEQFASGIEGGALDVRIGAHRVSRIVSTYADVPLGELCAVFGSTDHLEVAANGSSAAQLLDLGRGAAVNVTSLR
jgi:S-adenosyl-L-methionine hydrolase (adenosine-forming)